MIGRFYKKGENVFDVEFHNMMSKIPFKRKRGLIGMLAKAQDSAVYVEDVASDKLGKDGVDVERGFIFYCDRAKEIFSNNKSLLKPLRSAHTGKAFLYDFGEDKYFIFVKHLYDMKHNF